MGKTFKSALTVSFVAAADVLKNRFLGYNGNYAAANSRAYGVTQADTKTGFHCPVDTLGDLVVEAESAIAAGDEVCVGSNGKAKSQLVATGTAQAGAAGTITLAAGASAVDDFYNGMFLEITSGTGALQRRRILDYVGSTKVATVDPAWTTQPTSSSVYRITNGESNGQAADAASVDGDLIRINVR